MELSLERDFSSCYQFSLWFVTKGRRGSKVQYLSTQRVSSRGEGKLKLEDLTIIQQFILQHSQLLN